MLAKAAIVVLILVCVNSALLVVTVRSNSSADAAKIVATSSCEALVVGRADVNRNRHLNLIGWTAALEARIAAAAAGLAVHSNLKAARVYHGIIMDYTYLPRPSCLDRIDTRARWVTPPAKPPIPDVPAG